MKEICLSYLRITAIPQRFEMYSIEIPCVPVQAKSLGEHEWRSQQLGVLGHHFESDTEMSDIDDDDRETMFSSMDMLSPGGHSDAQTLAMMLQEQLDAINKEIRYLTQCSFHMHVLLFCFKSGSHLTCFKDEFPGSCALFCV